MESTVTIRPAAIDDLPLLLDLLDQLRCGGARGNLWGRPSDERATAVLTDILEQPGRALLVASIDGDVVGSLDLSIHANLTHGAAPVAGVENVVVDAGNRGRGIGGALMQQALERARRAGCYKIQLLSNSRRTDAHVFYESLGFERSAEGFRRYLGHDVEV